MMRRNQVLYVYIYSYIFLNIYLNIHIYIYIYIYSEDLEVLQLAESLRELLEVVVAQRD